jgi:hypothetical protein
MYVQKWISHSHWWYGESGRSNGYFKFTEVSMEDDARKKIDSILKFFAIRTTTPFNVPGIERAMYNIAVREGNWDADLAKLRRAKLYRQCASLQELTLVYEKLESVHKVTTAT